jgi:hypothetical protein
MKEVYLQQSGGETPFNLQWAVGSKKSGPVAGMNFQPTKCRFFKTEVEAIQYADQYLSKYSLIKA